MKNIYFFIAGLLSLMATGQTITHSTAQNIENGSVACGTAVATAANSYYRFFDLNSFGITYQYEITSVEFGIQNLTTTMPITVTLYATTESFPTNFPAGYNVIATQVYNIDAQDATIYSAPIIASVPVGQTLVVEVSSPDQTDQIFRIGSNSGGQDSPSYILAAECGITAPTDIDGLGFPDMHIVMNVIGGMLGVNDHLLKSVAVYPNPSKDIVAIQLPNEVELIKATLMDNTGKVFERKVSNNIISIADFATGIYFLTLQTDKGIVNKKIVKI